MTIRELIQALGGSASVARLLGVRISAVSNWIARGRIPPRWFLRISKECRRLGIELDEAVFGEADPAPQGELV